MFCRQLPIRRLIYVNDLFFLVLLFYGSVCIAANWYMYSVYTLQKYALKILVLSNDCVYTNGYNFCFCFVEMLFKKYNNKNVIKC